ncbi:MAG: hypothetical protein HRF51_03795 [bacterium]|jgi:hypothetical protein
MEPIFNLLLNSSDPSVKFKTLKYLLGSRDNCGSVSRLQKEIVDSLRVRRLLSKRNKKGEIAVHPYAKWYGAHWVLVALSNLEYPPGDHSLLPLRNQVYDWLFSPQHSKNIRLIKGLTRRCASQEGNAVFSTLRLGIADKRTDELAARLAEWQWPDGGWNCDKNPETKISSYRETVVPLRALSLHAKMTGNKRSKEAANKAAELILKRRIFKRLRDGSPMAESFTRLHYPRYFEYDYLHALLALVEVGITDDSRSYDALSLLESRRLPDGGFPCDQKLYRVSKKPEGNRISLVDWGSTGRTRSNEFVTIDALYVLKQFGHIL